MFPKHPIELNAIYTREEAAQCLGLSLSTLKMLIRTGQLTISQPVGMRRVLILGSSILEMLQKTELTASQPATMEGTRPVTGSAANWNHKDFSTTTPSRARQKPRVAVGKTAVLTAKPSTTTGGANR